MLKKKSTLSRVMLQSDQTFCSIVHHWLTRVWPLVCILSLLTKGVIIAFFVHQNTSYLLWNMIVSLNLYTVNPLYTDTWYKNNIHYPYNDNLTETKPSLRLTINQILWKNNIFNNSRNIWFGYLLELPQWGDSNKYPNHMFCEEMQIKPTLSYISFYCV